MCLWQGKSFACMLSTPTAKSDCGWTIVKHLLALVQGRKWQPKSKPYFLSVKKWQKHISILRHKFNQWTLSINTLTRCWEFSLTMCCVYLLFFQIFLQHVTPRTLDPKDLDMAKEQALWFTPSDDRLEWLTDRPLPQLCLCTFCSAACEKQFLN